jgi:peptidoglycan/LPS O-acetylase OafA/YrhL
MKKQLFALIAALALTISCAQAETDTQKLTRYTKKLIKLGGIAACIYLGKGPLQCAWDNSVQRTFHTALAFKYASLALLLYESL